MYWLRPPEEGQPHKAMARRFPTFRNPNVSFYKYLEEM